MKKREHGSAQATKSKVRRAGIYLHQMFQRAIERRLDPWPLAADLVIERLKEQGVSTSAANRRAVERAFRTRRFEQLRLKGGRAGRKPIKVTLTDADADAIAARLLRASESVPSIVRSALDKAAPDFLSAVTLTYPAAIRSDARRHHQMEASIAHAWRAPLESLAVLIELACRMMRTIDDYAAEHPATQPKLLHVLARLHIRGVHVSREVLTLLRCGYPDAAMARWRTLHEISTVMCLLSENGEECASRYIDFQAVQQFEAARKYQTAAERLGQRPISAARYSKLRAARDAAIARHGKAFGQENGWAAIALQGRRTTFAEIERAVDRSHLRPYYGLASDNVHAGIMGVLYKLGAIERGKLLVGPTLVGLEEPGQNTALSLALVLAQLLRVCPAFDALMIARTALSIADRAVDQFVSVGKTLKVTIKEARPRKLRAWDA